jgi:glycosyltransferase involved in cell wall biosynthesis
MRVGVAPVLDGAGGGIYQYSLSILRALKSWTESNRGDSFAIFTGDAGSPALQSLHMKRRDVLPLRRPQPRRLIQLGQRMVGRVLPGRPQVDWFSRCGIDLMIYPSPTPVSFECGVPFVIAIHDLQHRLQPEFPEVSADGEYEKREYLFRNAACRAMAVLADSEIGREDILNCYGDDGADPQRIKVLPFVPPSYLAADVPECEARRVRDTYRLSGRYLFYPAQFWPHKNHARIVEALALLRERSGVTIPMVFSGSHSRPIRERTFREVNELIDRHGLRSAVSCPGFGPDADMSALYRMADALVMPTFFGPTNIPVLEAWSLGCPVITSDIRGVREQCGDAALLVDPRSIEAIADGVLRLWGDAALRQQLAESGRRRLARYTVADFEQRFYDILEEARVCLQSKPSRAMRSARASGRLWWNRSPAVQSPSPS